MLLLTLLCAASIYTSYLLAALHELPNGTRLNTYKEMGEALLGECAIENLHTKGCLYAAAPIKEEALLGECG